MENRTAIVFPGQGAQFSGMGKDLYENSLEARKIFDAAESLRKGTISQCFEGTKEELSLTLNTQPCIFTVSLAYAMSLKEKDFFATAGFSVGELAALTYAGVFTFEEGFKAVCKRAELMHSSACKNKGSMAAVLKLSNDKVIDLCSKHGVYAVNFNCPGQIVCSGDEKFMAEFCADVLSESGRALPLAVSGAFHSPLMEDASEQFAKYLETVKINFPKILVYANLTAKPYAKDIINTLSRQIDSPVLWQQTIENMLNDGVTEFTEAEPGKILTGLIAKTMQAVDR